MSRYSMARRQRKWGRLRSPAKEEAGEPVAKADHSEQPQGFKMGAEPT